MNIRPATAADLPDIVLMGAQFYATTSYAAYADYDPDSATAMGFFLLDNGVLLVAEIDDKLIGMVGLVVGSFPFNRDIKTAHEVMWWVNENARHSGAGIALLKAVEPACRAAGVAAIQMLHLENSPPQAKMLYEKLGYQFTESCYTKEL